MSPQQGPVKDRLGVGSASVGETALVRVALGSTRNTGCPPGMVSFASPWNPETTEDGAAQVRVRTL